MRDRIRSKQRSKYVVLVILFLLIVTISLGYMLERQSRSSIITLMQTRMLDTANTAAAMINGDILESVTPEDKGTEGYESVMKTLTYFQDNVDLKYIYCIRDMGDGTFSFGLDPTVEFLADLYVEEETADKVSLRFGVFTNAESEPDVKQRFILAGMAADLAANEPGKLYGFYGE